MIAVIGGSGLTQFEGLQITRTIEHQTPYGDPSGPLQFGELAGQPVVFMARHGHPHHIAPHEINYRANLWALQDAGVRRAIAVYACGGIAAHMPAGAMVVPDQIVDYTWGRQHSFHDARLGDAGQSVQHVDFTEPYSAQLRERLLLAASTAGFDVVDGGTYAATQGPRLESAAEINRLERDGCDLVGMTGMPEAGLARELGLELAALCLIVNPAAGRGTGTITMEEIQANLEGGMSRIRSLLQHTLAAGSTGR